MKVVLLVGEVDQIRLVGHHGLDLLLRLVLAFSALFFLRLKGTRYRDKVIKVVQKDFDLHIRLHILQEKLR